MESNEWQTVLSRIISLVRREIQGFNLMDISRDYYKTFRCYLNPNDFGFKSMYELCKELCTLCDDTLVVMDRNQSLLKSDRIFFHMKSYKIWIKKHQKNQNIELLESLVFTHYSLPNDVLHQNCNRLPSLELPEMAFTVDYIRCLAAKLIHVESPNEIYIHLKTNREMYRELRESLRYYDAYYGDPEERYIFAEELVTVGYYCVVRNPLDEYNWHRAIIIDHNEDRVTLFAIDFGNTIIDAINELRLMKNKFFSYPPLAIKVSLAGIRPIGRKWSETATTFIRSFIAKYCADFKMASAFLFQLSPDYYQVLLGYTTMAYKEGVSEPMLVYLHEKMISRNLARMTCPQSDGYNGYNNYNNFNSYNGYTVPAVKYLPICYNENEMQNNSNANDRGISFSDFIEESESVNSSQSFDEIVLKEEKVDANTKVKTEDKTSGKTKVKIEEIDSKSYIKETEIKKEVNEEKVVINYKGLYFNLDPSIIIKERKYFPEQLALMFKTNEKPKYFPKQELKNESKPRKYFSQQMLTQFNTKPRKYFTDEKAMIINKRLYFTHEIAKQYEFKRKYFTSHVN